MSKAIGNIAEDRAAEYLQRTGYTVIDRNWRSRTGEIDIIVKPRRSFLSAKNSLVLFVEVKYRKTSQSGNGIEFITAHKLAHMQRAAFSWVQHNAYAGAWQLAAIEVSGPQFIIGELVFID